jgi:hypothetical protein
MIASGLQDGAAPTGGLAPELEASIRADLAAVPAPPWRWIGIRNAGGPQLVTDHSGRQYLLRAAKPTDVHGDELLDPELECPVYGDLKFRDQRDGERYSSMRTGSELGVGRTEYDPDALVDVDNPVAQWLKNSPAHAAALLAELDRTRAELKKYVGVEPTVADESAYLTRCLNAVRELCEAAKRDGSLGITIEAVEQAADGDRPENPDDRRRRIYIDGRGRGWVDASADGDGTQWVACITPSGGQWPVSDVRAETGGLHEIGRCF